MMPMKGCASGLRVLGIAVLAALPVASAAAQSYPAKPIRIVVPLAAGGPGDVLTRAMGQKLSEQTGQPVVIDNRPGANTNVGTEFVAKAPADGYTLLSTANHTETTKSLKPDSTKVGTSGSDGERVLPAIASPLILPP